MVWPWGQQEITEVRPSRVVFRGVPRTDWDNPERITHEGFEVQPARGGTGAGARDFDYGAGITRLRVLYGPFDTEIRPDSRIELPGESGLFTILDGPDYHRSAEQVHGFGDGPAHITLVVGIKDGGTE